jgi:translation elongation factor EF-G
LPFADQHVEIPSLTAGNIALTVGLKHVSDQMISENNNLSFSCNYIFYNSKNP